MIIFILIILSIWVFNFRKTPTRPVVVLPRNEPAKNESLEPVPEDDGLATQYQYRLKHHIMTPREEESYRRLVEVFDSKLQVLVIIL